jgi:hypothetical protein
MAEITIHTIQIAIHATLKKIDWNAWNRMNELLLYGSVAMNTIPVMNPARYVSAPATFVAIGCAVDASAIAKAPPPAVAPAGAAGAAALIDAPHDGQNAFPSGSSLPHALQKLMVSPRHPEFSRPHTVRIHSIRIAFLPAQICRLSAQALPGS